MKKKIRIAVAAASSECWRAVGYGCGPEPVADQELMDFAVDEFGGEVVAARCFVEAEIDIPEIVTVKAVVKPA